jgi:hypothetical protein
MDFIPLNKNSTWLKVLSPINQLVLNSDDGKLLTNISSNDNKFNYSPEYLNNDSFLILQPDESYAYAYVCLKYEGTGLIGKVVGYPEVKWCSAMGEFSTFRGEDTALRTTPSVHAAPGSANNQLNTNASTSIVNNALKVQCISCPREATIGESFEVTIRIYNTSNQPILAHLKCLNYALVSNSDQYVNNPNDVQRSRSIQSNVNNSNLNSNVNNVNNSVNARPNMPLITPTPNLLNNTTGLCIVGLTQSVLGFYLCIIIF